MTLDDLVACCKGEVTVSYNGHTVNYETVAEYILRLYDMSGIGKYDAIQFLGQERFDKLSAGNFVCEVQFYPYTPSGFYRYFGTSLQDCLEQIGASEWARKIQ